jgi:pSer/pThr/pTyr-binding forkhead associated (FHA) protein
MDDSIATDGTLLPSPNAAKRLRLAVAAEKDGLAPLSLVLSGTTLTVPVTCAETIVGRHSRADIRLPLPDVSRRHCRLAFKDGAWHIFDLDSLNGIYVNGVRVKHARLAHRDVVTIGGYTLEVDMRSVTPTVLLPFPVSRGRPFNEAA